MNQKVGVVGVGAVGQACAFALVLRGSAREIALVDRTAERATAVATDMRYGALLYTGQATDPNTGPLIALMAIAVLRPRIPPASGLRRAWPLHRARARIRAGSRRTA